LNAVVRRCNGAAAPFKLAPAYVLYLCAKYRLSPQYHSVGNAEQGAGRLIVKMVSKAVTLMAQTVQVCYIVVCCLSLPVYFTVSRGDRLELQGCCIAVG
jgi:hypothetical protein